MGNTEGNNEMISDSASPMLGQHLFRMESGVAVELRGMGKDETAERISSFVASDEGDVVWMG